MKENLKQKILLLLFGGVALGCAYSPRRQLGIIKEVAKEWQKINEKELTDEIRKLYRSKLVETKSNPDGSQTFVLTEKGELKVLTYRFDEMKIEKSNWDNKWRIVIFDIPEKIRQGRNALREKLKELGFRELQKSVFVFPFECRNELEFIIEFFNLRPYVRHGVLEDIDNDLHLKKLFKLN